MKEQVKVEIKELSDKLDGLNHKEPRLLASGESEKLGELLKEKDKMEAEIERLRGVRAKNLSKEAQQLLFMVR